MTAGEAGSKKEGDIVNLDGAPLRITRVDRSQVYLVEGKTPQGIAMGKVANYFNADAGPRQIVVSWTGEEMEYYSGMSTSARWWRRPSNCKGSRPGGSWPAMDEAGGTARY